jgi:hypothetical protein
MDRIVLLNSSGQVTQELKVEGQGAQPDYIGFYARLLVSQVYQALLQTPATAEQAKALAIFVSAVQDAMAGRVNPGAMQAAIWRLLAQVALTDVHLAELTALMATYHLSDTYLLAPPTQEMVRARDPDGQFIADDPTTPDVNEAWVEVTP